MSKSIYITADDVRDILRRRVEELRTATNAAAQLGITASQLSEILAGRRDPSDVVASKLGLQKVSMYTIREAVHASIAAPIRGQKADFVVLDELDGGGVK